MSALVILWVVFWMPNSYDDNTVIVVSKGESFETISGKLDSAGMLTSRFTFRLAARLWGETTRIQIGKYRFPSGMSNLEILEDLRWARSAQWISVTIPEGLRIIHHARIFSRDLGIDSASFVALAKDRQFAKEVGVDEPSLEGYLLPGTYRFYWQTSEREVLSRLVGEFWSFFRDSLQREASSMGWTVREVLTLASIVEWETAVDSERSVISGVYHNRLKQRMRLQADPTVQYVLKDGPRRLRYSDLKINSPYNTYLHTGLPPGPINNPGVASILAAMRPDTHQYLFFVATGSGGHTFTRRYRDHKGAVRQYRKFRNEQAARSLGE